MTPTRWIACLAVLCTAAVVAAGLSRGVLGSSAAPESTSSVTTAPAEVRRLIAAGSADLVEVAMEANRLRQPPGPGPHFIPIETRRIAFHVPAIAVRFLDLRDPYGSYRIGLGLWSRTLDPVRADERADIAEHCPRGDVMSCPGWGVRQAARVRDGEQALGIEVTSIIGVPEDRHAVLRSRAGHDTTALLNGPCEVSWDDSLGMLVGRPPESSPRVRACGGIAAPTLSELDREIGRQRLQATFLKLDATGQPRFVVLCRLGVEERAAPSSGNCELQGYFGEWPLFMGWPAPLPSGVRLAGQPEGWELARCRSRFWELTWARHSCSVVGLDASGRVVLRRRLQREGVVKLAAGLPGCVMAMEACCGAHHLGRRLRDQGHDVRLMSPEYVRPYVKAQKNDDRDAEAIAEAATRPTMRFVELKSETQLDMQSLHRARDRLVSERTALINQLRAFLLERGIVVPQGRRKLELHLETLLAGEQASVSPRTRLLIEDQRAEWRELDRRIEAFDEEFAREAKTDEAARLLLTIPGIGPLNATALVAAIGKAETFGRGRDLAAWLGLVPRQLTTGGKPKLLGISKRGNGYLRKMLIHGARAALPTLSKGETPLGSWLRGLMGRAHANTVVVALAAKLARTICAMLRTGQKFDLRSPVGS